MATFSKRSAFLLMTAVDTLCAHVMRLCSDEEVAKRVSSKTLSRHKLPDKRASEVKGMVLEAMGGMDPAPRRPLGDAEPAGQPLGHISGAVS